MAREILRVQESKGMFYAIVEFAVVVNVKRGYVSGARTVQSNDWSANVGQRGEPGILGTETTRALSPD